MLINQKVFSSSTTEFDIEAICSPTTTALVVIALFFFVLVINVKQQSE